MKHICGFTLLELLIVLLILSVLISYSMPGFRPTYQTQKIK
ncbi:MAG: hypothetical protein CMQ17_03270 [Gammaproteobacteria bacterium]|jgi:prepilin-type N-terminal cleavage/methylation domain-containing protein|nr:hypothetical protein [Gammaproteobacteria bacterium]